MKELKVHVVGEIIADFRPHNLPNFDLMPGYESDLKLGLLRVELKSTIICVI
jgi:hypothetical protein